MKAGAGMDACMESVVEKYGSELFELVMAAGMAGQAVSVLADLVGKHRSKGGLHAVAVLSEAFNGLSIALAVKHGWTEELVAQCDRDVQLAFAGKLTVIGERGSRIVLDS